MFIVLSFDIFIFSCPVCILEKDDIQSVNKSKGKKSFLYINNRCAQEKDLQVAIRKILAE